MCEALDRVHEFFFEEIGFLQIEAFHDPNNPASGRVMQKCGMSYLRTLKDASRNNQGICDSAHYMISYDQYVTHRRKICPWALNSEEERVYHDTEWGIPVFEDTHLFEMLILEYMQAGLSWRTILTKREAMRKAFDGFDPIKIERYDEAKIDKLMQDASIIRNKKKLEALPVNARAFLAIQNEWGSFSRFIWNYVDAQPLLTSPWSEEEVPSETALSKQISKDLKSRGFVFMGPVIVYSFLQAVGLVNDHLVFCHRYEKKEP